MADMKSKNSADKEALTEEEKTIQALERTMVKQGLLGDKQITDPDIREQMRNKQNSLFHCTEELLENYVMFKWAVKFHVDSALRDASGNRFSIHTEAEKILDALDKSGNIRQMRQFKDDAGQADYSQKLLDEMDRALATLKAAPGKGKTWYSIIENRYLQPNDVMTDEKVFDKLQMGKTKYYQEKANAIDFLSTILWKVPKGKVGNLAELFYILLSYNERVKREKDRPC